MDICPVPRMELMNIPVKRRRPVSPCPTSIQVLHPCLLDHVNVTSLLRAVLSRCSRVGRIQLSVLVNNSCGEVQPRYPRHLLFNLLFVCVYTMWGCGSSCHGACVEIRGQLMGICPLLSLCVGPRDRTQVVRLRLKCFYPLSHCTSPDPQILKM